MGSACFSRGNNATIQAVQEYIKSKGLQDKVELMGTLCQQKCREGPNVQVDDECLCGDAPATLPALLDKKLKPSAPASAPFIL